MCASISLSSPINQNIENLSSPLREDTKFSSLQPLYLPLRIPWARPALPRNSHHFQRAIQRSRWQRVIGKDRKTSIQICFNFCFCHFVSTTPTCRECVEPFVTFQCTHTRTYLSAVFLLLLIKVCQTQLSRARWRGVRSLLPENSSMKSCDISSRLPSSLLSAPK